MHKSVEELLAQADEVDRKADELEEWQVGVRSKLDETLERLRNMIERSEATARSSRPAT